MSHSAVANLQSTLQANCPPSVPWEGDSCCPLLSCLLRTEARSGNRYHQNHSGGVGGWLCSPWSGYLVGVFCGESCADLAQMCFRGHAVMFRCVYNVMFKSGRVSSLQRLFAVKTSRVRPVPILPPTPLPIACWTCAHSCAVSRSVPFSSLSNSSPHHTTPLRLGVPESSTQGFAC